MTKRKSKPQPDPTPTPKPAPRLEALDYASSILRMHGRTLVEFRERAEESVTEAMAREGEKAMTAEHVARFVTKVVAVLVDASVTDADAATRFSEQAARIRDDLVGDVLFGTPGRGPWAHNCTGAIHNVASLAKCDGQREIHHGLSVIVSILRGET
jgi:hypothetical protein